MRHAFVRGNQIIASICGIGEVGRDRPPANSRGPASIQVATPTDQAHTRAPVADGRVVGAIVFLEPGRGRRPPVADLVIAGRQAAIARLIGRLF